MNGYDFLFLHLYSQGYRYKEIAKHMGTTPAYVKAKMCRLRKELRRLRNEKN